MLKRMIILIMLSSVLLVLIMVKSQTIDPVSNDSSYTKVEYTITKIEGNRYYGKNKDGTEISFSSKKIPSGDQIQVHDEVILYFEKNQLENGVVKVEKK